MNMYMCSGRARLHSPPRVGAESTWWGKQSLTCGVVTHMVGELSRDHEKAPFGGADEDTSDVGMTTPLVNCAPYKWCRESSDPEA